MIQILCGTENYCIDKKIEKAKRQITAMEEFNLSLFYDDYMIEDIIASVCSRPLLSNVRVVILSLSGFKKAEELKRIADSVPSKTLFVLAVPSIDKRTAFYKAYQKDVVNCDKLDEETLQKFILQKAGEFGIRVKEDGVKELIDRTAYMESEAVNLYTVETVIKQLSLLKKDITVENVQVLLPPSSTGNAYALARFLCEKKSEELFRQAHNLLETGENEIGLLSLIARVFRLAWKDKVCGKGKCGASLSHYEMALSYPVEVLDKVQDILNDAVHRIKSGIMPRQSFDLALIKAMDALK